jgi:hypothetical protein
MSFVRDVQTLRFALCRSSHSSTASSIRTQAGSFLSRAANLIALMILGDIMVRNCLRSLTGYFGLRFGGFFFSTILFLRSEFTED